MPGHHRFQFPQHQWLAAGQGAAELADKEQFYSVQHCWKTGIAIAGASARVYVPASPSDPASPAASILNLAVGPADPALRAGIWPYSSYFVAKPGWHRIDFDLRQAFDPEGNPISSVPIDCIHVDLILPAASAPPAETPRFFVDDVELFTSLSTPQ